MGKYFWLLKILIHARNSQSSCRQSRVAKWLTNRKFLPFKVAKKKLWEPRVLETLNGQEI